MPSLRDTRVLKTNVVQVFRDVYQITFRATNLILIVEDELTLVDTGYKSTVRSVLAFVKSLGRRPEQLRLIVLTHGHFDHAGGVRELKRLTGARLACHRAYISDSGIPLPYPRPMQQALELRALAGLRSKLGISSADVDIKLQGGETLPALGGLKVIHTPGHTPGSICLLSPEHRLLIAGDALTRRREAIAIARRGVSSDPAQAALSAMSLAREDFDTICFGHHLPVMGNAKARIRELEARIRVRASEGRRTGRRLRGDI